MSMDVSRLAIEVTTTGIKEASNALGGLSRTAGTLDKRVVSLTANLAHMMRAGGNLTGSMSGLSGTMALINGALQSAAANAALLATALAQSAQGMNSLTHSTDRASNALQRKSKWGGVVETTLKAMTTAALAYVGVGFLGSIVKQADAWQMMQSRLSVVTGSMNNALVAQQQIYEVSQKLRTPLEANAQLYTRLTQPMQRMGKQSKDVIAVVEGVGMAMKLSGTTAAEASSAMLQLSQSFNAGRLNGAEFNSIAEAAPKILDAIVVEMNRINPAAKIGREELKKLGSDGKITGVVMAEAIARARIAWEADFKKLPLTVDDAMTRVRNAWTKAMGELNTTSGMNKGLTEAIAVIEELIPAIRDELALAFIGVLGWIKENKSNISEIWTQLKGVISDAWELFGAMSNVGRAIVGAGDQFSAMGFALYSVRLAVAGLLDGLTLVGAAVLKAGSGVWSGLMVPLTEVVTNPLKKIIQGFADLTGLLAKGADAVGLDGLSKSLSAASTFGDNIAKTIGGVQENFRGIGTSMADSAEAAFNMIANGEGAVARLLNEEKKITFEVEKRRKYDESKNLPGSGKKRDEKAEKEAASAAKKAMAEANGLLEKQIDLYREKDAALAALQKYGLEGDKRTPAMKQQLELELALGLATDEKAKAVIRAALAYNSAAQVQERQAIALKAALEAEAEYNKDMEDRITTATNEAIALERKVATYGMAKGELEQLAVNTEIYTLAAMNEAGATDVQIAKQEALIDALKRRQRAQSELGQLELGDKLSEELDKLKTADFGRGFGDAFGEIGKHIDKAGKALDQYNKKMVNLAKLRKDALNEKDDKKRATFLEGLRKQELKDSIDLYADMAGAVKGFFDEKTAAYKVFDAFEKGLRIAQMAMTMQELATRLFVDKASLASTVSTATSAAAVDTATTAISVSNSMTRAVASTSAGVAKVFEQMGVWGFVAAGALIAFMASLGVGGGGGGSVPNMAEERQKRQGTGTVLGDDEAKSESIARSLEALRQNSNIGLEYSSTMVMHLRNIDSSMAGLANVVARIGPTGADFGVTEGTTGSKSFFGLFGKQETTEINDIGLKLDGKVRDIINGEGIKQYLDLIITKSGFGGKTTTYTPWEEMDAGQELSLMVGRVMGDITKTVALTVSQLGGSSKAALKLMREFVMDDVLVSLKDLKGEDLQKALQNVFSSMADEFAELTLPGFEQFQRVGEGYFETLTRIASGTERAKNALDGLGVSMIGLADIKNKQGNIDAELVRESLIERESGTTLEKILTLLDGSMEDLIDGYKILTNLRSDMRIAGLGRKLTLALIRGAGGLDELADSMDTFFSEFYSEGEQSAMAMGRLRMEFGRLGMQVPASKAAFRSLVEQLMQGNTASQELAGRVLSLSEVFNDAIGEREERQMERISDAKDALYDAYEREAEALENLRDRMRGFASSLKDFRTSLLMGEDTTTLNVNQRYRKAQQEYTNVYNRAMRGDEDAIGRFQDVASQLLELSRQVNASSPAYTKEFQRVLEQTSAVQGKADGIATDAEKQLAKLDAQVGKLIDIDESVITVRQAIKQLTNLMKGIVPEEEGGAGGVATQPPTTTPPPPPTTTNNTAAIQAAADAKKAADALRKEVQNLRQEVVALREDQRKQTNAIVRSNFDGAEEAADKVVNGLKSTSPSLIGIDTGP